jgi:hypothetical protein
VAYHNVNLANGLRIGLDVGTISVTNSSNLNKLKFVKILNKPNIARKKNHEILKENLEKPPKKLLKTLKETPKKL